MKPAIAFETKVVEESPMMPVIAKTEKAKQLILNRITQRQGDDHRNKSERRHTEQYDRTAKIRLHPNLASTRLKKPVSYSQGKRHNGGSDKQRSKRRDRIL